MGFNKASVSYSIKINYEQQIFTDFNWCENRVRDQVPYPEILVVL